jgi:hypothetical protein
MTPARIAELRALCEAATAGPWRVSMTGYSVKSNDDDAPTIAIPHGVSVLTSKQIDRWLANAEFIAAARTALPDALDEIERLRATVATLK